MRQNSYSRVSWATSSQFDAKDIKHITNWLSNDVEDLVPTTLAYFENEVYWGYEVYDIDISKGRVHPARHPSPVQA